MSVTGPTLRASTPPGQRAERPGAQPVGPAQAGPPPRPRTRSATRPRRGAARAVTAARRHFPPLGSHSPPIPPAIAPRPAPGFPSNLRRGAHHESRRSCTHAAIGARSSDARHSRQRGRSLPQPHRTGQVESARRRAPRGPRRPRRRRQSDADRGRHRGRHPGPVRQPQGQLQQSDYSGIRAPGGSEVRDAARRVLDTSGPAPPQRRPGRPGRRACSTPTTRTPTATSIARMITMTETPAVPLRRSCACSLDPHPVLTAAEAAGPAHVSEFRAMASSDASGGSGVPVLARPVHHPDRAAERRRPVRRLGQRQDDHLRRVEGRVLRRRLLVVGHRGQCRQRRRAHPGAARPSRRSWRAGSSRTRSRSGWTIPSFAAGDGALLRRATPRCTAEAFVTGNGTTAARGILTDARCQHQHPVIVTTDGTFSYVDIDKLWAALPDRAKGQRHLAHELAT